MTRTTIAYIVPRSPYSNPENGIERPHLKAESKSQRGFQASRHPLTHERSIPLKQRQKNLLPAKPKALSRPRIHPKQPRRRTLSRAYVNCTPHNPKLMRGLAALRTSRFKPFATFGRILADEPPRVQVRAVSAVAYGAVSLVEELLGWVLVIGALLVA
ncbi:hypothetical protein BO82DRAFT_393788 [Aspergillus uvarum CBS 121591]|uniref:Uncharacterized protein n=1 Tax=Aspergillus uvarum CBS 121591 TaxID=1448315 RepID=A0A319C6L8_9EURO|nr:hypothetical protein BO82DRAFT_393788 [Aspergillus uvarum CBS 121591]PYH79547.1 hypothetical protein BO82DRAFT_393788 [Aspergillus uvarum CBS 121591]